MEDVIKAGLAFVGIIAVAVLISFLFSYPLMLLWNGCLVDAVTVLKPVTWLQMWGISVLISIMFKTSVTKTK